MTERLSLDVNGARHVAEVDGPGMPLLYVFDATGVRLRRVPFTPERVKRALA